MDSFALPFLISRKRKRRRRRNRLPYLGQNGTRFVPTKKLKKLSKKVLTISPRCAIINTVRREARRKRKTARLTRAG
jgi:hypothetical protein